MAEPNPTRTIINTGARAFRWPAAFFAVGVIWALAETLTIRNVFDSGFYFSTSFSSAFNGCVVFYGLISLAVWALVTLAAFAIRLVSRGRSSLEAVLRRGLYLWAAVAAWVNLTILAAYVVHGTLGVRPGNRPALILLSAVPALILVVAFVFLLTRMRRKARAVRVASNYAAYALLAGALALAAVSCVYVKLRSVTRPVPAGRPDVVLITLDAWRADAFNDDLSPAIAAYARDNALVYTDARAPSSWTLPSFAATFTGSYNVPPPGGGERRDDVRRTWAEAMRDGGYDTYAVVHNPHLDTTRFVNRGFADFDYVWYEPFLSAIHYYDTAWYFARRGAKFVPEVPGEANRILTDKALSVLREDSKRPRFLWVHYLDPHYPYQPTADVLRERAPDLLDKTKLGTARKNLVPENGDAIKTLYECEVVSTDREVARLLDELAARPDTLVIISSDHGEEFFEHGGTRHGKTVYDEVCRVPLAIALPKADGKTATSRKTSSPVSLVDLAPSVLNYVGLPIPPTMEGREDIFTGDQPVRRDVFVALNTPEYLTAALTVGDRKLITKLEGENPRTEYFDLRSDPGELKPLPLDEEGEVMRAALGSWLDALNVVREGDAGSSPFGDRADLRALGYM